MGLDRRSFAVLGGIWALISAALAVPAAAYLFSSPKTKKESDWIDAGDITRLPLDRPEEVVFRRNRVDGWKVVSEKNTAWVLRKGDNEIIALAPQCTHLGCAYHWSDQTKKFHCPCHTSAFTPEGKVLEGPAPRPLDRYAIKVENNRLLIGDVRREA